MSQPDDAYEKEADSVADQIMKIQTDHDIETKQRSDGGKINRKCKSCEEVVEPHGIKISRKKNNNSSGGFDVSNSVAKDITNLVSQPGSSLDLSTREYMESRFGYDFGKVRIHNNENAILSTNTLKASAYTIDNDIVFG